MIPLGSLYAATPIALVPSPATVAPLVPSSRPGPRAATLSRLSPVQYPVPPLSCPVGGGSATVTTVPKFHRRSRYLVGF